MMVLNDPFLWVLVGSVAVALYWQFDGKKRFGKNLTPEQQAFVDDTFAQAVRYAEQLWKADNALDRKKIAMDYAFDRLRASGIIPENYMTILEGALEAAVFELPPSHNTTPSLNQ